jgi:hypothetical protein
LGNIQAKKLILGKIKLSLFYIYVTIILAQCEHISARILSEINFIMLQDKTDLSKKIEELTALRKSISLDLKVIAKNTNIPTQILKNIELQDFHKLPPHPIRESFIKQYSFVIEKESKKPKYAKVNQ